MLIIGDVHGKVLEYQEKVSKYPESICVGDFGFKKQHTWHINNMSPSHKINLGNHDDPAYVNAPHSCGNFSFRDGIFTVRGADSIDKHLRTEGIDWFPNEELTYAEMQEAVDAYIAIRPSVVVTHDCPQSIRRLMFGIYDSSLTSQGLEIMLQKHQPDVWIFGHHHVSMNELVGKTSFICLAELETIKL